MENRIDVLRRFLPKKADFSLVTAARVKQVETIIDERPFQKFKYLTPNQVLHGKIALIC